MSRRSATALPSTLILVVVSVCVSLSLAAPIAQERAKPPQPEPDRIDEAHQALTESTVDRAKEAARLTDDLAGTLPGGSGTGPIPRKTFIDEVIFGRIERDGVPHAGLATDSDLVRRIYIDAIGLPPTPGIVRAYLADDDPAKTDGLIDSLVGTEAFAEQWAWFWGDLLRLASESGDGRKAFHFWFKEHLRVDRPYDQFVYDVLTPSSKVHATLPALAFLGRSNQLKGRFVMSADDYGIHNRLDALDQINVDINRVFLGINTSCVSCHNGAAHLEQVNLYLSRRKREEFYRQSAFLGKTRIIGNWSDRIKNVDRDLQFDDLAKGYDTADDAPFYTMAESQFPRLEGKTYEPVFMLTGEKPREGYSERAELARMITEHPQFARATVNLVWGKLMTVAFVEPYNGFDLDRLDPRNPPPAPWTIQPTNPELLEALAADFRESGFSLHHLIKTIMKSSAYQLSAHFPGEWDDAYTNYYSRRFIRVLTGPEVVDAIAAVTGRAVEIPFSGMTATRVKQLAGPQDVGRRGEGPSLDALMQSFYQSNRMTPAPEGNKASTLQAMLMMKSPVVNDRVLAASEGLVHHLLASDRTDEDVIEELFVATLARSPTEDESVVARAALQQNRTAGAENLLWALLNTPEFLINH